MKQIIKNKLMDEYEVIGWPEIQDLMDLPGFSKNARLINGEQGLEEYGSSAYIVAINWIKKPHGDYGGECDQIYDDELKALCLL